MRGLLVALFQGRGAVMETGREAMTSLSAHGGEAGLAGGGGGEEQGWLWCGPSAK